MRVLRRTSHYRVGALANWGQARTGVLQLPITDIKEASCSWWSTC